MKRELKNFIKNINIKIVMLVLIIIIIIGAFVFTTQMGLKKEITIEIGTKALSLKDFYKHGIILNDITFITDVSKIDLNKTGDYKIALKEKNKEKHVTLHLVDTTAPVVVFKNVEGNKEYIINPQDFIESIDDISETTVTITNQLDISDYNVYDVNVVVSDKSGNKTEGNCKLNISFIKLNYELELGNTLKKSDLVYAPEDEKYINQEDIDKINNGDLGKYEINTSLNGVNFTSKIIKQDTLPPELELNKITIYTNQKVKGKESFIKSVKDASGEITTTLKSEIDYSKLGNQRIVIEAVDKYNNKIEKETTLTIKVDDDPPKIYGL